MSCQGQHFWHSLTHINIYIFPTSFCLVVFFTVILLTIFDLCFLFFLILFVVHTVFFWFLLSLNRARINNTNSSSSSQVQPSELWETFLLPCFVSFFVCTIALAAILNLTTDINKIVSCYAHVPLPWMHNVTTLFAVFVKSATAKFVDIFTVGRLVQVES